MGPRASLDALEKAKYLVPTGERTTIWSIGAALYSLVTALIITCRLRSLSKQ